MNATSPSAAAAPPQIALWGKSLAELPPRCAGVLLAEPLDLVEPAAGSVDVVLVWLERYVGPGELAALVGARRSEAPGAHLLCYAPTASQSFCEPALAAGFDDVMAGRRSPRELVSRIKALGRRRRSRGSGDELRYGPLCLDVSQCRLRAPGRSTSLTRTETRLLAALIRALGDPRSREELLASAWSSDSFDTSERAVDNAILRLRRKLPPPISIATVRGVGFRLELS